MASELRKRQFIGVFITDKTLATMTGRPPLLSRRYSTCQLPLDLSEEQLMADEPELSHIRSKLDSDGWNTSGEVYPSTWARALLLMNLIREEVLEMSLSISNDCSELMLEHLYPEPERKDAQERCADLIRRCVEMYDRLPQSVRYDPSEPVGTNAHVFPRKVGLHMLYLHCQFLLERLCVSRTHASSQRIVDLAMQMLDDVLIMWAKRDWLVDFQWRFNHYVSNQHCTSGLCLIDSCAVHNVWRPQRGSALRRAPKSNEIATFRPTEHTTIRSHAKAQHLHQLSGMGQSRK